MDMEGTGIIPPGCVIFSESHGYIAYDIPDNPRGSEHLTQAPMDDMWPLYDPNGETNLNRCPRESGAIGNDANNTYFCKDW